MSLASHSGWLRWSALTACALFAGTLRAQPTADEVVIRGLRRRYDTAETTLSAEQARATAGTQGDPSKAVENLPGLARAPFGSDQIVLWGAAPEDTRFYVDGVEIPQLFHGSGIRSTVNGDLLQSVAVAPGAYGPDYGRGIGGLVRLETRELPDERPHAYVDASTLDGSALVSSQVGSRVRVALAARYGWLDRTLGAVTATDVGDYFSIPRYTDYQAKVQLSLRDNETLDVVALGSADERTRAVPSRDPAQVRSLSTRSGFERIYLRYRRVLGDGSAVSVVPWIGRDTSRYAARFGAVPADLDQQSTRWGLRAEHRSHVALGGTLSIGVDASGSHADLVRDGSLTIPAREGDITVFGQPPGGDTTTDAWHAAVVDIAPYATLDFDWGPLTLRPGLRLDAYLLEASRRTPRIGQTPSSGQSALQGGFEPRLGASLRLSPRVALLAAFGVYSQPPAAQDLSAVYGTPTLGLESAVHASLGESLDLTQTLSATVTGFYRSMSDLAARDPAPTPKLANALVADGVGRSYGLQLLLRQKPWHGLFGWVAYTISRSERRDSSTSSYRLFDYDEPHVLTVVANKELGRWTLGVRFRCASGAPRTPVVGALYNENADAFQPIFGAHNSVRLPAFWQLDVRVDRTFPLGDTARVVAYLEALNVTNHSNGEEYNYSVDYTRRGVVTGLPIVGVVGVRLEL